MDRADAKEAKILIVDDEPNIREVCSRYLELEGYKAIAASDGEEAIRLWREEDPDLIVLDLMMPKLDGWTVCEQIRRHSDTPIIMLTARMEEMDRLMGLTIGADDYIGKPFSPKELVLRVRAILRRVKSIIPERQRAGGRTDKLVFENLEIELQTRCVLAHGKPVELTVKEFDLLWLMASHPEQVFSRNQLLNHVWEMDFEGDTTTVTVHMRRLREKIEPNPSQPTFIKTVWGIGYKFGGAVLRGERQEFG